MQWSSSLFWTNSFFMLAKTLESTKKFSWELTEKIWFQKIFASSKQMFSIDKNSTMLLRMNLPWIFTIYDIYALQKLSEDFQENIFGRVILVYDCYSEQSVSNLTKMRTLQPVFSGEIFENEWLWTAASEQSKIPACN